MPTINQPCEYNGITCIMDEDLLLKIFDLILYKCAPSKISPLSVDVQNRKTAKDKYLILKHLLGLASTGIDSFLFSPILNNRLVQIDAMGLSDDSLRMDYCKGYFQKAGNENTDNSVHRLDSLFRHLRNAVAHGRVIVDHDFLLFEDYAKRQITTRFVIDMDSFRKWIDYLESVVNSMNTL